MMLLLTLYVLTLFIEFILFTKIVWKVRHSIVILLSAVVPALSVAVLFQSPTVFSGILCLFSLGRIFNYLRIGQGRMHQAYLLRATSRTSHWFICGSFITVVPVSLALNVPAFDYMLTLSIVQLITALLIALTLLYNLRKTSYRQGTTFYSDKELPTLSVLVPARNETTDLELCLRSLLDCDYPKLEIIVLDDCSHISTSDIIKKFAHDGVRFIKGAEPDDHWLAKNAAYERLAKEATGEVLLFCGVDTRLSDHTLRAMVTELNQRDKQMLSILPRRITGTPAHAFVQPLRYWWELALPRTLLNRPAVLSTCWMIRAASLKQLGSFGAVRRSVIPERYFARELTASNDYSFIRANDILDVQTTKQLPEQLQTAIRTKYPQFSKRPEVLFVALLGQLLLLVAPFALLIIALIHNDMNLASLSALTVALLLFIHTTIVQTTNPSNVLVAALTLPYAVVVDIVLSLWSMYRYEFATVIWKERNVCIPVMHVMPRLPNVD